MAEFTQTMSGDSRYSIKLTVIEVIPSDYVTTNKTNVNYTLTATKASGSGYWNNNANNPITVTINNSVVVSTTVAYDFRNATPKTITLASGTVTGIEHNADGSKTIKVGASFQDKGNSLGSATISNQDFALTTIPRASQPIVYDQNDQIRVSATLGESLKIETFRASSNFKHTLKIKIGNSVVEQFGDVDDEKKPWIPAVSTYAPHISTQSATAIVECTTYNGQTELGTKTYNITLTVPRNSTTKPVANISIAKGDNVVPVGWGVYVKGKSKLAVTISGTPYHTTIKTYSSTTNGATNTNSSYTTSELTTVGTNTIKATVTDNRNYTSDEASQTYTVQDYFTPTLSLTVERCNSSGVISDEGTYIKYSLTGDIASVSSNNHKSFVLKYREKTGSTWTQIFSNTSNYSISASGTQYPASSSTGVFNIEKEYVFRLEAEDYFYKSANNNAIFIEQEIGTVADLLNFNASGKSMAIGGVSQRGSSEKALDVFMPTYLQSGGQFSGTQGTSWVKARDSAYIRDKGSSSNGYRPLISAKTPTGEWSIGNYNNENLLFSYTTDTNYNNNNNSANTYSLGTNGYFSGSCASASSATNLANRSFVTRSSTGDAGWTGSGTNPNDVICRSLIAYWNGAYSGTTSNLQYCDRGRFGTIVTKGTGDYTNSINNSGAMIYTTSNYTFSATAWANTQVAFSGRCTFSAVNSNFTQNGNGIKCNFAGWVMVNGVVCTDKTNEFDAGILKGSTQIIRAINTGGRQSYVSGVFQVANGDTVYLAFASSNTSGTIYNTTHLTIMRIS